MNQRFDPSLLSGYLDGELSPAETALVEKVLAEHPEHQAELESIRGIRDALARWPAVEPTADPVAAVRRRIDQQRAASIRPSRRLPRHWAALMAMAASLMGVAGWLSYRSETRQVSLGAGDRSRDTPPAAEAIEPRTEERGLAILAEDEALSPPADRKTTMLRAADRPEMQEGFRESNFGAMPEAAPGPAAPGPAASGPAAPDNPPSRSAADAPIAPRPEVASPQSVEPLFAEPAASAPAAAAGSSPAGRTPMLDLAPALRASASGRAEAGAANPDAAGSSAANATQRAAGVYRYFGTEDAAAGRRSARAGELATDAPLTGDALHFSQATATSPPPRLLRIQIPPNRWAEAQQRLQQQLETYGLQNLDTSAVSGSVLRDPAETSSEPAAAASQRVRVAVNAPPETVRALQSALEQQLRSIGGRLTIVDAEDPSRGAGGGMGGMGGGVDAAAPRLRQLVKDRPQDAMPAEPPPLVIELAAGESE